MDRVKTCTGPHVGISCAKITFNPDGRVLWVIVVDKPFSRTEQGLCVSRQLRTFSVPPFDGSPMTVVKMLSIQ